MRQKVLAGALVVGIFGSQAWAQAAPSPSNGQQAVPATEPVAAAPVEKYVVPAGTKVLLSLKSPLNTRTAHPGDAVYLVSTFPVVIQGHILIPDGVYVQGVIDRVVRPGKVKGRAQISMHFTTFIFPNGQVVAIPGTLNGLPGSNGPEVKGNEGTVEQTGSKGRDLGSVQRGAELGGLAGTVGGAASGSWGEGIGYGILGGAALGAVSTLFTRGEDISIPGGAAVEMVLQRPLALEPQKYAAVDDHDPRSRQMYAPLNQPEPLKKPGCSSDGVGCN